VRIAKRCRSAWEYPPQAIRALQGNMILAVKLKRPELMIEVGDRLGQLVAG
jgi:hypothetical protein